MWTLDKHFRKSERQQSFMISLLTAFFLLQRLINDLLANGIPSSADADGSQCPGTSRTSKTTSSVNNRAPSWRRAEDGQALPHILLPSELAECHQIDIPGGECLPACLLPTSCLPTCLRVFFFWYVCVCSCVVE